ncbi:hypothetical protein [Scleromatobacter humisilvae]|uniref:Uncharacterized protein n=1 Tax=Scleromatobacter humisilvae TaxID=2897159 RepID=A0A9X1YPZ1_9BURK|nr:hypothetical protein [Scleromatobacter humisilvae]MCK9688642.1 hypothetical protein [Scleromatobacter humisilvae]
MLDSFSRQCAARLLATSLALSCAACSPGESKEWVDVAQLHDGSTLEVTRLVRSSYGDGPLDQALQKLPHFHELSAVVPGTQSELHWKGPYEMVPVMLDFVDGVPYLVILQNSSFSDMKSFGCPEIPFVFLKYEQVGSTWRQIQPASMPAALTKANLSGGDNELGQMRDHWQGVAEIAEANLRMERMSNGYFATTVPRDFASWNFANKEAERHRHFKDGCHVPQPKVESLLERLPAQSVALEVLESTELRPELVLSSGGWAKVAWDAERESRCDEFIKPEYEGSAAEVFIKDLSGLKRAPFPSIRICERDALWLGNYVPPKSSVILSKYLPTGERVYTISFKEPDALPGHLGALMAPTFKVSNGYMAFDWWDSDQKGEERYVIRRMKVRLKEPN